MEKRREPTEVGSPLELLETDDTVVELGGTLAEEAQVVEAVLAGGVDALLAVERLDVTLESSGGLLELLVEHAVHEERVRAVAGERGLHDGFGEGGCEGHDGSFRDRWRDRSGRSDCSNG